MVKVEKRARSCIDPRKYSHLSDWEKRPVKDNCLFTKSKRVTLCEQRSKESNDIPGPPAYDKQDNFKKIVGFYGNTEVKMSVIGSTAFEKNHIPGPSVYESRGKGMSALLKEKAK